MKIFYSDSPLKLDENQHSVFLAGPTPRSNNVQSWRPHALNILNTLNYMGQVILPEHSIQSENIDYDMQVEWEHQGLMECKSIVFWIPRNLKTMPGFTTNVEFGRFTHDVRTFYGRPDDSEKNRYLDWLYKKVNGQPIFNNLEELLKYSIREWTVQEKKIQWLLNNGYVEKENFLNKNKRLFGREGKTFTVRQSGVVQLI